MWGLDRRPHAKRISLSTRCMYDGGLMPRRLNRLMRFLIIGVVVLTAGCGTHQELTPMQAAETPQIAKGRALFNDVKLSGDGKWSCASCHPNHGHTNNKTYVGLNVVPDGDPNGRSTPTLWGVGTRHAFSWAGTAPSLQANMRGIIVNRMKGPEPSPDALGALEAYVRSLGYPANSNLNADGTPSASAPAPVKRGHQVFMRAGCQACHVPPTFEKKDVEDIFS